MTDLVERVTSAIYDSRIQEMDGSGSSELGARFSMEQLESPARAAIAAVLDDLEDASDEMLGAGWYAMQLPTGGTNKVHQVLRHILAVKRAELDLDKGE